MSDRTQRWCYQRDAYQARLRTRVQDCRPAGAASGFDVVLEDTPLYPEGGGQPPDHGSVCREAVLGLRRDEDGQIVHRLERAVQGEVEVALDWARRFDHMQ